MVLTSSRILSCEVWLILMRNTSAPASNSLRIIALSEEAGPRVARILIRRRRLIACFRVLRLAADPRPGAFLRPGTFRRANWTGQERCRGLLGQPCRECRVPAARAAHW